MIVEAALREDVDIVGLSILSGAHMELFPQIVEGLYERGMENVVVVAGGIVPDADREALRKMGVREIFGPGSPTSEIVKFIRAVADRREG